MVDQATMKSAGGPAGAGPSVSGPQAQPGRPAPGPPGEESPRAVMYNVASFGENLVGLAELQARLATIELRQNVGTVKAAGPFLLAGMVLVVASLPVLLIGIAELLVWELALPRGIALLLVALCGLVIGALSAGIAGISLRKRPLGFPLATEELARNLQWIRTVLKHSGRPSASR